MGGLSRTKGVEVATGVAALLRVEGAVAGNLDVTHQQNLNDDQGLEVEGDLEAKVLGALELNLAGIHLLRK